jgi:hypothetical protein
MEVWKDVSETDFLCLASPGRVVGTDGTVVAEVSHKSPLGGKVQFSDRL